MTGGIDLKAYDLKASYENIFKTYIENTIGRNIDVFHFIDILDSIEDGCTIALDGKWGSGKTFFVKQTKMVLDAHNAFTSLEDESDRQKIVNVRSAHCKNNVMELQPQICVYYDAWENDNDADPVLSLVYTILKSVDVDFSFKDISGIKAATSIMEFFSGRNWNRIIECFKSEDPLEGLRQEKGIEKLVSDFLEALLHEKGNRLVIFIDELDRCKPSYAVCLLERIKHYFANDKITFVFSVNINELQHTIRKHYGNEFDGTRYLDRFFDLRITLPPPDLQRYYSSLNFDNSYYTYDIVCGLVIKSFHFELREIAKYLRLAKIAAYKPTHSDQYSFRFSEGRARQFGLLYIVPIMIGLNILDIERYFEFIEGRDCSPLIEIADALGKTFFEELLNENETYYEQDTTQTVVTLESKLKEVYDVLFGIANSEGRYSTTIGQLQFGGRTKDILLRTVGLLSEYTNMDFD